MREGVVSLDFIAMPFGAHCVSPVYLGVYIFFDIYYTSLLTYQNKIKYCYYQSQSVFE